MAAQHLAAVKIQGAIRRFLYLKRKAEKKFSIPIKGRLASKQSSQV